MWLLRSDIRGTKWEKKQGAAVPLPTHTSLPQRHLWGGGSVGMKPPATATLYCPWATSQTCQPPHVYTHGRTILCPASWLGGTWVVGGWRHHPAPTNWEARRMGCIWKHPRTSRTLFALSEKRIITHFQDIQEWAPFFLWDGWGVGGAVLSGDRDRVPGRGLPARTWLGTHGSTECMSVSPPDAEEGLT